MVEKRLETWQLKSIYALAGGLKMTQHKDHQDDLHILVYGITGKSSIKALSGTEADIILTELRERMKLSNQCTLPRQKNKLYAERPGGVTQGQRDKIWALMYDLQKQDTTPPQSTLGRRLCAIIHKELHLDAGAKDPFCWMAYKDGNRLIEVLKGYVATAKRKVGDQIANE